MKARVLLTALLFAGINHVSHGQNQTINGDLFVNENLFLTGSNGWVFHTPNDGRTSLYIVPAPNNSADWNKPFTFTPGGRFGIGTYDPAAKLHVVGAGAESVDFLTTGRLKTTSNTGGLYIGDANSMYVGADGSGNLTLYNGSATRLFVQPNGQVVVGSGTAATGYQLSVRGKTITEEVKVGLTTAWPDYVFAPTYSLRPLAEVGRFIAQNQHLPGLPSAREVATDGGIELGKMNAQLLEKVEELTLYLLEQQKRMEGLEKQMAELKSK